MILSYFATDSQSVSQSVLALRPSGTHDQILAVVRQLQDDVMGHPPWQVDSPCCEYVYLFGNSFLLLNLHIHLAQGPLWPIKCSSQSNSYTYINQ